MLKRLGAHLFLAAIIIVIMYLILTQCYDGVMDGMHDVQHAHQQ